MNDVSDNGHPFGSARQISIEGCLVQAMRITYVGELGWELHLPVEYAQTVYNKLIEAGSPLGLRMLDIGQLKLLDLKKVIVPGRQILVPIILQMKQV